MSRIFSVFIASILISVAARSQCDDIAGYWLTEERTSQIKIFKSTRGKYYGKIVWMQTDPDSKDDKNPDPALRQRQIMGLQILNGFSWSADGNEWNHGTIYDPENGNTYDCYMWFGNNKNILKIKGYVLGMRFLGRETVWTKEDIIR